MAHDGGRVASERHGDPHREISMNTNGRRTTVRALAVLTGALMAPALLAGSLADLTNKDAAGGLRAALGKGIDTAVGQLGAPGGFLDNEKLRIPLPSALEKADRALRMVGMSGEADDLKVAMNRAAESAVGEAKPVLAAALKRMTISDAKGILTGGDDSATQYFRRTSGDELRERMKPIVARATEKAKLGAIYDRYAGKAAQFGLVSKDDAHLDDYVTGKALDGLFAVIAEEEHSIRANPLAAGSSLIKKVFSSL
jgi:hypothetical protein